MPMMHLPRGFLRTTADAFRPKTIIDTLFDYGTFLNKNPSIASDNRNTSLNVLVIGGGAAGLSAAYELSKIKNSSGKPALNITLAEATDRLGGRMDSQIYLDPGYKNKIFELGCMRFPPTSTTLYHYFNEFGITTTPNFPDPGKVPTTLYYMNEVYPWPAGQDTPDSPLFKRLGLGFKQIMTYLLGDPNAINYSAPSKLFDFWAIYDKTPTETNKAAVVKAWQIMIDRYKDTTFYTGIFQLARNPAVMEKLDLWTTDDMNAFGALGVGSGGFSPLFPINFLEIIRLFANGWEDNQELVADGIVTLVNAFEKRLIANGVDIRLNQPLTFANDPTNIYFPPSNTICWEDTNKPGYRVKLKDGTEKFFNAIVVATTTRAMELMNLTVPRKATDNLRVQYLSKTPQAAVGIRNLNIISSSKLFVLTKKKFWYGKNNRFKRDLVQNIQTDGLFRGLYCLNYDGDSQQDGKGVVLISYVWGDDSDRLLAMSAQARYEHFLDVIKQIDPDFAKALEENRITGNDATDPWKAGRNYIDWQDTPYQYGAFKLNYPGQEANCHDVFFQYQTPSPTTKYPQNIFLAGDSVSWAGGWLEGALPTGINAACAVSQCLEQHVATGNPLNIGASMYQYDKPPVI